MWDLVGNPDDWFSHNEAQMYHTMTEPLSLNFRVFTVKLVGKFRSFAVVSGKTAQMLWRAFKFAVD